MLAASKVVKRAAVWSLPSLMESMVVQQQSIRCMGGGPRNLEHKERLRALRKKAKQKMVKVQVGKGKRNSGEPPDAHKIINKHIDEPIPKSVKSIQKKLEDFIVNVWLIQYPEGARLRKLQRDIAFRMERKDRPGKLPYEHLLPIVGTLRRKGLLNVRLGKTGQIVIYKPTDEERDQDLLQAQRMERLGEVDKDEDSNSKK